MFPGRKERSYLSIIKVTKNRSGSTEQKLESTESLSQNQTNYDDQRPIRYQYFLCPKPRQHFSP